MRRPATGGRFVADEGEYLLAVVGLVDEVDLATTATIFCPHLDAGEQQPLAR